MQDTFVFVMHIGLWHRIKESRRNQEGISYLLPLKSGGGQISNVGCPGHHIVSWPGQVGSLGKTCLFSLLYIHHLRYNLHYFDQTFSMTDWFLLFFFRIQHHKHAVRQNATKQCSTKLLYNSISYRTLSQPTCKHRPNGWQLLLLLFLCLMQGANTITHSWNVSQVPL